MVFVDLADVPSSTCGSRGFSDFSNFMDVISSAFLGIISVEGFIINVKRV